MNKLDLITTRDYQPEDRNFLTATWLRGLYFGNDWFNKIHKDTYFEVYNKIINDLIQRPTTTVKIACLKDSPDVILGYSVYSKDVLHWCQVKSAWRGIGIAKSLVPESIKVVSHLTKVGVTLMRKKQLIFNPFSI